jgi:cation diffusion facilitator CzcD-associated flavoprotein CzcO
MRSVDVAIIGAGFAGVCAAIRCKQAGLSLIVFEKGDTPGGVWRDNAYPGAGCDVPSLLYSYSFEPKLDWGHVFAKRDEIHDYIIHCARKYDVLDNISCNEEVTEATFDERSGTWSISCQSGAAYSARVLVSAVGQLNRPSLPAIPDLDQFRGAAFHSARWDHSYDFHGKSVGVMGNGASAVQFIPQIAPLIDKLTLFQRSPGWVDGKSDRAYSPQEHRRFLTLPLVARYIRWRYYWFGERNSVRYQKDTKANLALRERCLAEIDRHISDPQKREALRPNYAVGCKRLLKSNDWYPTLARDNVSIVTDAIERATKDSVVTSDGTHHRLDALILATGFQATRFLTPMKIVGLGGAELAQRWRDGAQAYRGVAVPAFPNFFIMYGPNTNTHNSIVGMLEGQAGYIVKRAKRVVRNKSYEHVKEGPFLRYSEMIQSKVGKYSWSDDCGNWYKQIGGIVTNNWPDYSHRYRVMMMLNDSRNYSSGR